MKVRRIYKKKSSRQILALDLARKTGYAVWDGYFLTGNGVKELAPASTGGVPTRDGVICLALRRWLDVWFRNRRKDIEMVVYYEMPVAYGRRFGVGRGFQLESVLLTLCEEYGVEAIPVAPPTLKKASTGNGRASKADMIEAAEIFWGFEPQDDNEADALCLLMHARKEEKR